MLGPYSDSCAEKWWRVRKQVLCGLLHSASVQKSFHGMFSGEAHVHKLNRIKDSKCTVMVYLTVTNRPVIRFLKSQDSL